VLFTYTNDSRYVSINYVNDNTQSRQVGALNGSEIIPLANTVNVIIFGGGGGEGSCKCDKALQ
jgi:hypothetical protein